MPAARSSSRPAPGRARRRCSSSGSCAPCARKGSTSSRCSSSPTRARRPASCARASAPRCTRAAGPISRAGSTARGSRRSTASARGCCARIRSRSASTRGSASSTTSTARCIRGEAFERALAAFCATRDAERLRLLATYGAQGLRRKLTGVYETLRSAGRDLTLELERAGGRRRAARRAARGGARARGATASAPTSSCAAANAALALSTTNPERCSTSRGLRAAGDRAGRVRGGAQAARAGGLRRARAARQASCCRSCSTCSRPSTPPRSSASRRSTSRTCSCSRATCCATTQQVREQEQLRFRAIMVDEFQDTNRLQCELDRPAVRRPARARRLLRRRRVPVDLRVPPRRRRRSSASAARRPRCACRSRATTARGPRCSPPSTISSARSSATATSRSRASGEFTDPVFGHPVELHVTDKRSFKDAPLAWRDGEAKAIARRVRELVDAGVAAPGEIVLLFAAGTDAERYEAALRAEGLPTYRATGRGYFGQQQVVDLLAYLRLLHNRYDDEALVDRARVAVRRRLERRARPRSAGTPANGRSSPGSSARCPSRSRRTTSGSCARSSSGTSGSSRRRRALSLERLCEEIVSAHDYDLAVLAQWDGKRRYANLRKLMRLARSYESLRGPDVEGFVEVHPRPGGRRRVTARGGVGGGRRRRGAPADDPCREGARVQGRDRRRRGARHRRPAVGGRDHRAARRPFGFRVDRSEVGQEARVLDYEAVREAEKREDARRAAAPLLRRDDACDRPADRVGRDRSREARDLDTPIGWVLARLERRTTSRRAVELERGDARFVLRVTRLRAGAAGRRAGRRAGRGSSRCSPSCPPRRRRAATACRSSCRSRRRRCTR